MKRQRGFTLIETTVAVALLAVIVVTILSAFSAITLAARRHQQGTTLDLVTRQDTEFIKSQAYSAAPPASPYTNIAVGGYSFSYQVLYYDPTQVAPAPQFSAAYSDNGLQELVLTVTGPNNTTETLDFLKVQP
jgi:prepilin-type N-terminal cleavage/methylation domain-containing protein